MPIKYVYNPFTSKLDVVDESAPGITTFDGLSDTPGSKTADYFVKADSGGTNLEYFDLFGTANTWTADQALEGTAPAVTFEDTSGSNPVYSIGAVGDDFVISPDTQAVTRAIEIDGQAKFWPNIPDLTSSVNFSEMSPVNDWSGVLSGMTVQAINGTHDSTAFLPFFRVIGASPNINASAGSLNSTFRFFDATPTLSFDFSGGKYMIPTMYRCAPNLESRVATAAFGGSAPLYMFLSYPGFRANGTGATHDLQQTVYGYSAAAALSTASGGTSVNVQKFIDFASDAYAYGAGCSVEEHIAVRLLDDTNADSYLGISSNVTSGASKRFIEHTGTARSEFGGEIAVNADNTSVLFGAGDDAEIYYDGTDLIIDPDAAGSGEVVFGGRWRQTTAESTGWSVSNHITTKSFNANSTTLDEIADVVGTLIEDVHKITGLLSS